MNIKYYCNFCKKDFELETSKNRHEARCIQNPRCPDIYKKHKTFEPKCECYCSFCNKKFNYKSAKTLHQKYCNENPNKETFISRVEITEDIKEKIREKQKASWRSGNRKPITRSDRSYPETYFDNIFTDACKEYFQIGYFLDYAWPEKMCYVEVDGEQHFYFSERVQHDIKRTQELSNIGWTCIARVRWSEFMKLNKAQKEDYIKSIKEGIKSVNCIPDLKPTLSKRDKKKEESLAKRLRRDKEIDSRRQFILSQSDIDYTKFGWLTKLSERVNITSQALSRWIRKYMPDFYKKYGIS